jgi:DNA-binding SARP family transcriptional activator
MLEVRLMGGFEVKRDDRPVAITSRSAQSLFAYLILNAGTAHRREKLAGLLWPDSTEENARDYLRHGLWKLRKAIEKKSSKNVENSYILTDDISVSFNSEAPYSLDTATIENIEAEHVATDELTNALSLYEGELLPGFYDEWIVLEREHLQALFEQKMECLLERLGAEARWNDILEWGERWISLG